MLYFSELNELRKPTADNPDILRFFKYMRAAKDGQDGLDCNYMQLQMHILRFLFADFLHFSLFISFCRWAIVQGMYNIQRHEWTGYD